MTYNYEVPAGKRAVVRCVTAVNRAGAQHWLDVWVAGVNIVGGYVPAERGLVYGELRVVAYAGEVIQLLSSNSGLAGSVSGYLFDDPGESFGMSQVEVLELHQADGGEVSNGHGTL